MRTNNGAAKTERMVSTPKITVVAVTNRDTKAEPPSLSRIALTN